MLNILLKLMSLKPNKLKAKSYKLNRGMSMIELIVVLSIFALMSGVSIFNFGNFQGKVDIKNLASDIALKTVQAQKAAVSGVLPPAAQQIKINARSDAALWKPSYGVYFNKSSVIDSDLIAWNKKFYYFTDIIAYPILIADLNTADHLFTDTACGGAGGCLDKINITKGNYVSNLDVFYIGDPPTTAPLNDLTISFVRPNLKAEIFSSSVITDITRPNISYVQITISSPKADIAKIKIYPSGRIQVQ